MKNKYSALLLSVLVLTFFDSGLFGADDNRATVAVAQFEGERVTRADSLLIQENITSYIVRTDKYTVVERSQLSRALSELRLSNSDMADSTKAIRVGKLLSAYGMVLGTIIRSGNSVTINARLVETARGSIVRMSRVEIVSRDRMDDACKVVAYELANRYDDVAGLRKKLEEEVRSTRMTGEEQENRFKGPSRYWLGLKLGFGLSWFTSLSEATNDENNSLSIMGEIDFQFLYYAANMFALKFETGYWRTKGNIGPPMVTFDLYTVQTSAVLDYKGITLFAGLNLGLKVKGFSDDKSGNYHYDFGTAFGFTIGGGYSLTYGKVKFSIMAEYRMTINKPVARTLYGIATEKYRLSMFCINAALLFGI